MTGPTAESATYTVRFRLVRCHTCGWTAWTADRDGVVLPGLTPPANDRGQWHEHDDLWEEHTFFADDRDGPGFPLTQVAA